MGDCDVIRGETLQPCCGWDSSGTSPAIGILIRSDDSPYWDAVVEANKAHNFNVSQDAMIVTWAQQCLQSDADKQVVAYGGSCFKCEPWPSCKASSLVSSVLINIFIALIWPIPLVFGILCLVGYNSRTKVRLNKNDEHTSSSGLLPLGEALVAGNEMRTSNGTESPVEILQ